MNCEDWKKPFKSSQFNDSFGATMKVKQTDQSDGPVLRKTRTWTVHGFKPCESDVGGKSIPGSKGLLGFTESLFQTK